jgi:hypothetical protein
MGKHALETLSHDGASSERNFLQIVLYGVIGRPTYLS